MTWLAENSAAASDTPAINVTATRTRASRRRCHGMCGMGTAAAGPPGSATDGDCESGIDDMGPAGGEAVRLVNQVDLRRQPLQQVNACPAGQPVRVDRKGPCLVVEPLGACDRRERTER